MVDRRPTLVSSALLLLPQLMGNRKAAKDGRWAMVQKGLSANHLRYCCFTRTETRANVLESLPTEAWYPPKSADRRMACDNDIMRGMRTLRSSTLIIQVPFSQHETVESPQQPQNFAGIMSIADNAEAMEQLRVLREFPDCAAGSACRNRKMWNLREGKQAIR